MGSHVEDESVERDGAKRRAASRGKRPYRSPRLVVYGDLRRLTTAKGGTLGDGGGKPTTRVPLTPTG